MTNGLRALLEGAFDYAASFPPEELPLEEAIENYARYSISPTAWLLGRLVVPAAQLEELAPWIDKWFDSRLPLLLNVVGRGGDEEASCLCNWRDDLLAMVRFREEHGTRVELSAAEMCLPPNLLTAPIRPDAIGQLLHEIAIAAETLELTDFVLLLDAPINHWSGVAESISRWRDGRARRLPFIPGLTLQTGGPTPQDVPTPEQLAEAICDARDKSLHWKAVGGLRRPIRGYRDELGMVTHGFLNVLMATVLANAAELEKSQLVEILSDEEPSHFYFDDRGCYWELYGASVEQVEAVRARQLVSLGSGSFDEPRTELEHLHLLASEVMP